MAMEIKAKLKNIPEAPGVYLFKDSRGKVIYIGKAKSLKKRVASYFSRALDSKTGALVSKICDIEYRISASEPQAQILEAALIKESKPRYNIGLKDDKSFPWIRITKEEFPIVSIYRKRGRKQKEGFYTFAPPYGGAQYSAQGTPGGLHFGPYTNVKHLRQAIKLIRRIFGFRTCKKFPKSPCLYYRVKLCPAPCAHKISRGGYLQRIEEIKLFLNSRYEELLERLNEKMQKASGRHEFEEAARLRDQLLAISALSQDCSSGVSVTQELEGLKKLLGLKRLPLRVEAFDISNISGREATGSMVSFYKGIPDKGQYRRFRIKSVQGIDDYAMLREVVLRRYLRLKEENLSLPDLVLIDGGRGHLLAAEDEIRKLGLRLALASIAKENENIYTNSKPEALSCASDTPALNLIRRIRDEAHRFALKYHHLLHRKKIIGR